MFLPAANSLGFSTNSIERARIDSSGSVQIRGDSTDATFTSAGQLAIKRSSSDPVLSFHANAGSQIGNIQMQASGTCSISVVVAQPLAFNVNGSERMKITSAGVLDIGTGAGAVGQIQFPATQVASANANTLDDYEEGTWTPTQGGNLAVVGTFSSSGSYTKIGRFVVAKGLLIGSTSVAFTGGSPAILCAGLPFTSAESALGNAVDNNFNQGIVCTPSSTNVYGSSAITATGSITFSVSYFV
tara:strand:- start:283 stop:1011 length:729 start_codon:yes stop_codon:yes gene_type:complete